MTIIVDTREQKYSHVTRSFDQMGVKWVRSKLLTGDYTRIDSMALVVDRKKDLQEVCGNICQQHDRFRRELERAQENGIKLVFLVESGTVNELPDVMKWDNPRLKESPYALSGVGLYRRMATIQSKYGVEWKFCRHQDTGKRICELLGLRSGPDGTCIHSE